MSLNIVKSLFEDAVYKRADDNGAIFYFTYKDFDGLNREPFSFSSCDGHTLQGYFYYYDKPIENRLVIFEHGMGSGHTGYMKEIEMLARHGYLVFAYDHTGCMESGGETTGGFVQSLKDLNDALNAIRAKKETENTDISVIGHSWGGFSTMNICKLHPEISHAVAMSGFISVESFMKQILGSFYKKIYQQEEKQNPEFIKYNALDSLEDTSSKVLIIHSQDDPTVKCSYSFDVLYEKLKDKENIKFLKVSDKKHNPNYTKQAVEYKDEFFFEYRKSMKKKLLDTEDKKISFKKRFDWNKMTEQDTEFWNMIFDFLDT